LSLVRVKGEAGGGVAVCVTKTRVVARHRDKSGNISRTRANVSTKRHFTFLPVSHGDRLLGPSLRSWTMGGKKDRGRTSRANRPSERRQRRRHMRATQRPRQFPLTLPRLSSSPELS